MATTTIKKTRKATPVKGIASSAKSDQKRDDIVRAATEIINNKSYAEATLVDIAAALNLRDATLYHYFPDKRALAYACHMQSLQRFEALLQRTDDAGGAGARKLRSFIRNMLDDSASNGPLLYFGDYSYLHAPQRKAISQWALRLMGVLKGFLEEGMQDGSITACEPELVVNLLVGMIVWFSKWVPGIRGLTVDRMPSTPLPFKGWTTSARTRRQTESTTRET